MTVDALDRFEHDYLTLWSRRQLVEWENLAEGATLDPTPIDLAIHEVCQTAATEDLGQGRRAEVARQIISYASVEQHPDVATRRNRLEALTGMGGPDVVERAESIEEDVIELLETRNTLAQTQGYPSFGHLTLAVQGLDFDTVVSWVERTRDRLLPEAAAAARRHAMSITTWFDGLDAIVGRAEEDAPTAAMDLAARLGLAVPAQQLAWTVADQPVSGYATAVSVPDDVRILVRPVVSVPGLLTAFHELGHALGHACNRETGLFTTWNLVHDETMGVLFERIGARLLLDLDTQKRWETADRTETARMATSFLFEAEAAAAPQRARDAFVRWFAPLAAIPDPVVWAADSFRTIDPFLMHAYVVGRRVADATIAFLSDQFDGDHAAWGSWIVDHYFADGRSRPLADKVGGLGSFLPGGLISPLPTPGSRP